MSNYNVVGKPIPKLDAAQKAMGRAQYIQDIKLPEMLYGKILYSRYAHAKIINIDISKAKALPGVHAVLTGDDVPQKMVMGFYKDNPPIKKGQIVVNTAKKAQQHGEPGDAPAGMSFLVQHVLTVFSISDRFCAGTVRNVSVT